MDQGNADGDVERPKVNEYTCVHTGVRASDWSQWGLSPTRAGSRAYAGGPWRRTWPGLGPSVCVRLCGPGGCISRALGVCVCVRE